MRIFGIDISEFQSGINFKKIKKEKIEFVMLRAGYTGSSNGVSKAVDSCFNKFYKEAKKNNLKVGAYWFSRANSYGKGREEAKYMYEKCLKGKQFEYPIAIDVEDSVYQNKASKKDLTSAIKGFCEYLESKGYWVIIYANSYWFNNKMKLSELKKYDKWVASWSKSNPKNPAHGMWQFGGETNLIRTNKIAGYTVDQDYAYKDYPKLIKSKGLNGFTKNENNKKNKFRVGEYITLDNMNVRTGPGVNYRNKKVKELTVDGKRNAVNKKLNSPAVYKKGTEFTALEIIDNKSGVWAKTPSGYVCIKLGKNVYCRPN